jgi:hypothetical protein
MQAHFEINVSHLNRHLFATHERSCVTMADVERVLKVLKQKFPEKEGYSIMVYHHDCTFTQLDI